MKRKFGPLHMFDTHMEPFTCSLCLIVRMGTDQTFWKSLGQSSQQVKPDQQITTNTTTFDETE